jgi:DNA polymerase (family 10)
MVSNRDIGRLFSLFAELLLLHKVDERLSALLSGAAYRIPRLNKEVVDISKPELEKLFRPTIIKLIAELKKTATIAKLDELVQLTPSGLFDMMRVRGLGGKKLSILWHTARIDNVDTLLDAAKKNKLIKIKGFGRKTQQNIIAAIESLRANADRFHFAFVADTADSLVAEMQRTLNTKLVSLCGEVRRQNTTIAAIEILAGTGLKKLPKSISKSLIIQSTTTKETRGHTIDEIPVIIYHSTQQAYQEVLFRRTGNEQHVKKVLGRAKLKSFSSEAAIYKSAKLPFIPPELREDVAEWEYDARAELVEWEDIKGVVHNHTTWSDGVDRLEDFVTACRDAGYEYCVISEHSKNAHYAGGMKEEKVLRQMAEIDLLNKKYKTFRIYKSIECDILVSGDLDYDESLWKQFDLVIASIHQLQKMDEERATKRLIRAIENPYTTILGHMTGRQLLIRPGYPVNFVKVIDACAANGVAIEINANPYRLDMDWSHIPYAMKKEVMLSINPDAHSIGEIDNIRWGVVAARKGGLLKKFTLNAKSSKEFERHFKNKH